MGGITVGCLYLPNGNPAPGPKFDYKLRWFDRFIPHAASCSRRAARWCSPATTTSSPTEQDVYKPERWVEDALFLPETREAYRELVAQGWTDSLRHIHPDETVYTFWDYMRGAFSRNAGLRIDHLLLSPRLAPAEGRRGGPRHSGDGEDQRPRADVDRTCGRLTEASR